MSGDLLIAVVLWFPLLFPKTTGRTIATIVMAYRAAITQETRDE